MPVTDAMRARHVVRQYLDTPLSADVSAALSARVDEANASHGTDIRLLTGGAPVYGPLWGTVRARSVRNCLVLTGPQAPDWFTHGVEAALLAPLHRRRLRRPGPRHHQVPLRGRRRTRQLHLDELTTRLTRRRLTHLTRPRPRRRTRPRHPCRCAGPAGRRQSVHRQTRPSLNEGVP